MTNKYKDIAIKVLTILMEEWQITDDQASTLLSTSKATLKTWVDRTDTVETCQISDETIVTISLLLGIHKSINTILQDRNKSKEWIQQPNQLFNGKSALSFMLSNPAKNIREVHGLISLLGARPLLLIALIQRLLRFEIEFQHNEDVALCRARIKLDNFDPANPPNVKLYLTFGGFSVPFHLR